MQKIMFNDKFYLTRAVLDREKRVTRRLVKVPKNYEWAIISGSFECTPKDGRCWTTLLGIEGVKIVAPYRVGEIVAIAQRYEDLLNDDVLKKQKGWSNKMYVKPDLMPHRIKITEVRLEHLQDISFEDCLAEGIDTEGENPKSFGALFTVPNLGKYTLLAREAYAALIDKISGKGTWDSNPYVWVYEFELIK